MKKQQADTLKKRQKPLNVKTYTRLSFRNIKYRKWVNRFRSCFENQFTQRFA